MTGDSIAQRLDERRGYRLTRALFVRLLGAVFAVAFASIAVQILGLYGGDGIIPIEAVLKEARPRLDLNLFLHFPSLFWFNCQDSTLAAVPIAGACCGILALLGVATGPALLLCWFLYLSIVSVGQEFMSFQWDILLLESGFLSILFASWKPFDYIISIIASKKLPHWSFDLAEPSIVIVWLYRFLLFRLMFASGLVKVQSDENWRNLSALNYHFETQPLPTPIGWMIHQFPSVLAFCTMSVFIIELIVPFLIFAPRKFRLAAAVLLVALQLLILLSGNYCFFNWLTIILCLPLLDDSYLCWKKSERIAFLPATARRMARLFVLVPLTAIVIFLSSARTIAMLLGPQALPEPAYEAMGVFSSFHIVSSYGLFAVMTTERPEITIEGSMDGKEWKEYVFKYKPGPLNRPPPIVAPHQPRLDWQMWFAALGTVYENQWLVRFVEKLLHNSPSVLALIETNPFADKPPVYIRAIVYDYKMTNFSTLKSTGNWWRRELKPNGGIYLPAVSVQGEL